MIGIIGAMDMEVRGIIEEMTGAKEETISSVVFTSGTIEGRECVIAKCGIGKVNAALCTQTMILHYKPDVIINTGIAGSTSSKTHIGSVVIADKMVQHDFDTTILGDPQGTLFLPEGNIIYIPTDEKLISELEELCTSLGDVDFISGTIATGDQFIGTKEKRLELNSRFGAVACEMEGGSIGQVCYINKVPFAVLRSISDDSTNDAQAEYNTFSRSAAQKAVEILTAYITRNK